MKAITVMFFFLLIGSVMLPPKKVSNIDNDVVWVYEVTQPVTIHGTGGIIPHSHVWMTDHVVSFPFAAKISGTIVNNTVFQRLSPGFYIRGYFFFKNFDKKIN